MNKEIFREDGAGDFKDKVLEFSKDEKLFDSSDGRAKAIFTAGFIRGVIWMIKTFPQLSSSDPSFKEKIVEKLLSVRKS